MSHPKAVLTPIGRFILVRRIAQGAPGCARRGRDGRGRGQRHTSGGIGTSRRARPVCSIGARGRCAAHGGLRACGASDRGAAATHQAGSDRIGVRLHMPASTVHRVLVRRQLNRLSWMDRPTGRVIRRYEHEHPGDLVHVDVKKLGRIPPGGGWRMHGRLGPQHPGVGYDYVHSAVDDHSRLAYSEICADERGATAAAFWTRARAFFAAHGIAVQRVLTDNAFAYRNSVAFHTAVSESGAVQRFIQPRRPRPMARSSASTARCSRNGPTFAPTPQTPDGPRP